MENLIYIALLAAGASFVQRTVGFTYIVYAYIGISGLTIFLTA